MGIPTKGSRTTLVDGREFRYLVKETHVADHLDQKELSVTVQENSERPGNVLQFRTSYGYPVTSDYISVMVRRAFTQGWRPEKRGPAFMLGV